MNKNIVITGSTDGIGKLVALKLAQDGHSIYLHGRNKEKLDRVISEIKTASNNDKIDGFVADFSDLHAVSSMADQVLEKISSLDILINNAGIFKSPSEVTEQGLDIRFAVNYLAPYLLTDRLLPLLHKSEEARIINLSSAAQSPVSLEALKGERDISASEAYAQSKLALTMWSFNLSAKLSDIAVVAVNPGSLLNTNMVKEAYGRHWSSADKGRDILYKLSVDTPAEELDGNYFDNDLGNFNTAHSDAYNLEKINNLIITTQQLISN